jgi:hypothetical protein
MEISVEICKIAIMPSSDNTGKQTKRCQIGFFKKEQSIAGGYTYIADYLIGNHPEFVIGYMSYKVGHVFI